MTQRLVGIFTILMLSFLVIIFSNQSLNLEISNTADSSSQHCQISQSQEITNFTNEHTTLLGHSQPVGDVKFSPDDSLIASASLDGTVIIWNASNGEKVHLLRHQPVEVVREISFSPNGSILASSGHYWFRNPPGSESWEVEARLYLWDTSTGSLLKTVSKFGARLLGACFSPDGKLLAFVENAYNGTYSVNLWDFTSNNFLYLGEHNQFIFTLDFSPDGSLLASGSDGGTIKLWDIASRTLVRTLTEHTDDVRSIKFSPNGQILASACDDTSIILWNVSSGSVIRTLTGHNRKVFSVDFSNDDRLVSGEGEYDEEHFPSRIHNAAIKIWDIITGNEIASLTGHENVVCSVDFSSDGTKIVSGSWDWRVKLWGDHGLITSGYVDDWPTSTPEEQGMNSTTLNELFEYIDSWSDVIHGLCVMRHGVIVAEGYFSSDYHQYIQEDKHQTHSVTKSFTSALIGIAIDQGYITDVNQRVLDFFPEMTFLNVDSRKEAMTIEHLLTMRTGLDWPEMDSGYSGAGDLADQMLHSNNSVQYILDKPMVAAPGEVWQYCSGATHLLSAIIQRTTGQTTLEFAQENLFSPLGIDSSEVIWDTDRNGINRGHSNLFLTPRSLAKFGYLYLNEGKLDGKEIISKEWVEKSVTTEFSGYGYCWWNDPFGHFAMGLNGHYIYVLPEENIVASFTESSITLRLLSRYIIPAVIQSKSSAITQSDTASKTQQSNDISSTQSKTSGLSLLYPTLALLVIIMTLKRKKVY
ncbi:MAG: serine hydrolase [Candidatus Heimdallarchaeota archaeon]|nr:MAG: serine hydrolase [Candidatus Heimdallarchaeota archaeon]